MPCRCAAAIFFFFFFFRFHALPRVMPPCHARRCYAQPRAAARVAAVAGARVIRARRAAARAERNVTCGTRSELARTAASAAFIRVDVAARPAALLSAATLCRAAVCHAALLRCFTPRLWQGHCARHVMLPRYASRHSPLLPLLRWRYACHFAAMFTRACYARAARVHCAQRAAAGAIMPCADMLLSLRLCCLQRA